MLAMFIRGLVRATRDMDIFVSPDHANVEIACDLSALAVGLRRRRFPAGLHKYRSVEEASRLRERWELGGA